MRVLLDTNIIIHREANRVLNKDIGILFNWFDKLSFEKCIHPRTVDEIRRHECREVVETIEAKMKNYNLLKTEAPEVEEITAIRKKYDCNENDEVDTSLLKEVFCDRVDFLISEDRKVHEKASSIGIASQVFTIDEFLEKVITENPTLADYKVLAVKQEFFGNLNFADSFFDSLKQDYPGFDKWFNRKADEKAYVCYTEDKIVAFLFLKKEDATEDYSDINPPFERKTRLKIGTLKVDSNGYRLGERFLKIVFDNALLFSVDELYVTIFDKSMEHIRLIKLLEDFGFYFHGYKNGLAEKERVYVRDFSRRANRDTPKLTYPFLSAEAQMFLTPIYPQYHTELFPDSILRTESPENFIENEPHRNAISKVYISRATDRKPQVGDVIVFYRTGGFYKSVVTTIGIVEHVTDNIQSEADFIQICKKRSVFTEAELSKHWNYRSNRPFVINFLYSYSFPSRINMERLIEIGILTGVDDAPRGFKLITSEDFINIIRECNVDESIIVH